MSTESTDKLVLIGKFDPFQVAKFLDALKGAKISFTIEPDDSALKNQPPRTRPGSFGRDVTVGVFVSHVDEVRAQEICDSLFGAAKV